MRFVSRVCPTLPSATFLQATLRAKGTPQKVGTERLLAAVCVNVPITIGQR